MVERGKLGKAVKCLERAAILAPEQDYVHRHLAIVRARISRLPKEELLIAGIGEKDEDDVLFDFIDPHAIEQGQQQKQQSSSNKQQKNNAVADDHHLHYQYGAKDSVFLNQPTIYNQHSGNKHKKKQQSDSGIDLRLGVNLKSKF